jgi:hypothetical protein
MGTWLVGDTVTVVVDLSEVSSEGEGNNVMLRILPTTGRTVAIRVVTRASLMCCCWLHTENQYREGQSEPHRHYQYSLHFFLTPLPIGYL